MDTKGQAAMEFLMTYGWAILAALVAIGALAYFGVFNHQGILPERTLFSAPVENLDIAVISLSDHTVAIAFKNSKGVAISIPRTGTLASPECIGTSTVINVTDNTNTEIDTTTRISPEDTFVVTWSCTPVGGIRLGNKFKADAEFDYLNVETGQKLKNSGTIEGKFS
jgi:hypothetical protein